MHLSISTKFSYKDLPKNYRGLRSSNISFGSKQPVSLAKMCISVLSEIFDWYTALGNASKLNKEIETIRQWLATVQFNDEPVPPNNPVCADRPSGGYSQATLF